MSSLIAIAQSSMMGAASTRKIPARTRSSTLLDLELDVVVYQFETVGQCKPVVLEMTNRNFLHKFFIEFRQVIDAYAS